MATINLDEDGYTVNFIEDALAVNVSEDVLKVKVTEMVTITNPGGLVGDMYKEDYDPNAVEGDAFDMDNMVESNTAKILTVTERNKIAASASQGNLDTVETESKDRDTTLQNNVNTVASESLGMDNTLQSNLDAVESASQNADSALNDKINTNETASNDADTTLQENIDTNRTESNDADTALTNRIDGLVSTYDPEGVGADAFSMDNMVEGDDAKILTAHERDILAFELPGVLENRNYISKVDDSTIAIAAGSAIVRKNDDSVVQVSWEDIPSFPVTVLDGELNWITIRINNQITNEFVIEESHLLSIHLHEFEKKLPIGRVWKNGTELIVSPDHILLSNDKYISRTSAWKEPAGNISVTSSASQIDPNYIALSEGELFRFPITNDHGHHTFTYMGDTQVMSMWNHLQGQSSYSTIDDNGVDGADIKNIANYYDNAGVQTLLSVGDFSIHRIGVYAVSNELVWLTGQNAYSKLEDAELALSSDSFTMSPWAADLSQISIVGYLILQRGCTDFTNASRAKFVAYTGAGGGGIGSSHSPEKIESGGGITYVDTDLNNIAEGKISLGTNGIERVKVDADGTTTFGDIVGGNTTEFEPDGTLVMKGDSTCWDDIAGSLIGKQLFENKGTVDYNFTENALDFSPNGLITKDDDCVIWNYQYPHKAKADGELRMHIHFEQTSTTDYEFTLNYRVQRSGQPKTTAWSQVIASTNANGVFTYTSGTLNQIATLVAIDMTGMGISAQIQFRMTRTDGNAGIVSATFVDGHYEADTLGSNEEYVK